ncbi:MAG: hypothetical protein M3Z16_05525, partial [Pseudomonadota bacterium]|nr:hypothetical protein [Pseudomonadota bacterium]
MAHAVVARADFSALRSAGKEPLSLALIETRNETLRWATALESALDGAALTLAGTVAADGADGFDPPLWTLGHLAWRQELLVARNVRRSRGEAAEPSAPRLASRRDDADRCYDPALL